MRPAFRHGQFITIEGLDGCGKSTQLDRLAQVLRSRGRDLVLTREPGGTGIGDNIRALLLNSSTANLSPRTELALMFAARAQHIEQVIVPALHARKLVLCDRFTDSSEAYQGGGRELGSGPILELHRILCDGLQPDLTILLDSDVEVCVERARRRNLGQLELLPSKSARASDENRFERESREFFERVHQKYLEISRREPERFFVVNGRRSPDAVFADILEEVKRRFLAPED